MKGLDRGEPGEQPYLDPGGVTEMSKYASGGDEPEDLGDVIENLKYGTISPSEEDEPETNPDGPAAGDPDADKAEESTPEPDKPEEESKDEPEEEPAKEAEPEPESGEAEGSEEGADDEDKSDEPEDEGDGATLIELDGEKVTLEQIREWKNDGLRHADYTRKRQADAKRAEQLDDRDKLVAEIVSDDSMQEFVKAHPGVLPALLADPENTRALLGNADEIQRLWDDYALIADNPSLAERFARKEPDAEAELVAQRTAENVQAVANALDQVVDSIAERPEFDGVDADEVKDYVLKLGRVPTGEDVDPNEVVDAFGRLYNLMFVQDEDGIDIDTTLIEGQFSLLKGKLDAQAAADAAAAEEHNREVDEQLKDAPPPATPEGDAPAPAVEEIDGDETDVNEIIQGLLGQN
jgi:hypothetical protein